MKKEGKKIYRTKMLSSLFFIISFAMILLVFSLLVYGDGYTGPPYPAAHQTLYVNTITSKTTGETIKLRRSPVERYSGLFLVDEKSYRR